MSQINIVDLAGSEHTKQSGVVGDSLRVCACHLGVAKERTYECMDMGRRHSQGPTVESKTWMLLGHWHSLETTLTR